MRREWKSPARHAGVVKNWPELPFQEAGIEKQKERRTGIGHVHGVDGTVREVFFRKEQRRAVDIGGQLVSGDSLPISEPAKLCVGIATGRDKVGGELPVKLRGTLLKGLVVPQGPLQEIGGFGAMAAPVRAQLAVKVFNGIEIVIGEYHVPRNCRRRHGAELK